ncbi:2Fe-2S iron-sulfur cluster-binding protein [Pseudorhodobacter aquimaris]|uniref:2Fe-2S iron-sulfur cluster-binding protein n=1 Tax=Pseudorhodobacter aquimaris TaxID=687412 RepID=UPI001E4ABC0D|nr:2Fe-2S iron-sulfur cluster-binding protein [Pseudorhodobacter aquimaris]
MQVREYQTDLDVVSWIKQHIDPSLSYRYACRVGMCGSFAMMVSDQPRWICRTQVKKVAKDRALRSGPLCNLPVIKDLATDMDPFFDKWIAAGGCINPTKAAKTLFPKLAPRRSVVSRRSRGWNVPTVRSAMRFAIVG